MPIKGHVHKIRLVVNSGYDTGAVGQSSGLSVKQCVKNFHLGRAISARKDYRSYVQVVAGKCESNPMSHHKVHSDTVKQYSHSTQKLSAHYNTSAGLEVKHDGSVWTKCGDKQAPVVSDSALCKLHPSPQRHQVSNKTIIQPPPNYIYEDRPFLQKIGLVF